MTDESYPDRLGRLSEIPRSKLFSGRTAIEHMPNLTAHCGGGQLYVKRDDLTELAFGGNKVRQLEYYLGQAVAMNADTVLITGAFQSNFVRLAAAGANKLGMDCHIQLEERVAKADPYYRNSGNVLLDRLLGAELHSYPEGEDETGADRNLNMIADDLKKQGKTPYIIPLSPGHPPYGALGYVRAGYEIAQQMDRMALKFDEVFVATGSGNTHAGLLFGLRAVGIDVKLTGVCVRRDAASQRPRIEKRCEEIAALLQVSSPIAADDIRIDDSFLAPGYGKAGEGVMTAIFLGARREALLLDPTYTGKVFAAFLQAARKSAKSDNLLFIHTGGAPALFAYQSDFAEIFSDGDAY